MAIAACVSHDLTSEQRLEQISNESEVSATATHIRQQHGSLTHVGTFNLLKVNAEIRIQDIRQFILKQAIYLTLHEKTVTEPERIDWLECLSQKSDSQFCLLEFLSRILTFHVIIQSKDTLRQQFDETVACRLGLHPLIVKGKQVTIVVAVKRSFVLGNPLTVCLWIEVVQQKFCPYLR